MRARILLTALAVTLLSVATAMPAQSSVLTFQTGNELLRLCQADSYSQGICLGFVMGVADAMEAAQSTRGTVAGWRACRVTQVTGGQAEDVVLRFLTRHPEQRHLTNSSLVAQALAEAFPCPAGSQRRVDLP
jgi:hypothetical protein